MPSNQIITIANPLADGITSVSYNSATNTLTFTRADGTTDVITLASVATLVSGTYSPATKDATFTLSDGSTVVLPLDDVAGKVTTLQLVGNTLVYVDEANTATVLDLSALSGGGGGATGDMTKAVYDTNGNGVVDNSEKLGGKTLAEIEAEVASARVQTDWDESDAAKAAYLMNKPDIPASNVRTVADEATMLAITDAKDGEYAEFVKNRVTYLYRYIDSKWKLIDDNIPAENHRLNQQTNYKSSLDGVFNLRHTLPTYTNLAAGNASAKGYGGAVFDGRYVYFAPYDNGNFHGLVSILDTTDNSVTYVDLAAGNANAKGYAGAVFDGRYVYFVPYRDDLGASHGLVSILDTTDNSVTYVDLAAGNANAKGYAGAVFDGRYVYFAPYCDFDPPHGLVSILDTTDNSVTYVDLAAGNANAKGYHGAVFDGRYVYFVPLYNGSRHGLVSILDTTDNSVTYVDLAAGNANAKGYAGAVFDGRYVYFVPLYDRSSHGLVSILDTTDNSVTYVDLAAGNANAKGYYGAVFDGRYVYFVPLYNGDSHGLVARLPADNLRPNYNSTSGV